MALNWPLQGWGAGVSYTVSLTSYFVFHCRLVLQNDAVLCHPLLVGLSAGVIRTTSSQQPL